MTRLVCRQRRRRKNARTSSTNRSGSSMGAEMTARGPPLWSHWTTGAIGSDIFQARQAALELLVGRRTIGYTRVRANRRPAPR